MSRFLGLSSKELGIDRNFFECKKLREIVESVKEPEAFIKV